MIDGSEKRNRQLAFELQNSHVCEKRSKVELAELFSLKVFHLYILSLTLLFDSDVPVMLGLQPSP